MFYFETNNPPSWISIESHQINISLNLYMYSASKSILTGKTKNPYLKNTISVWFKVCAHLAELPHTLSQFSPIYGNNAFQPGRSDSGFKFWASQGITKVADLYDDKSTFMSFEELKSKYTIPSKHFFKYLQLRSFIMSCQGHSLQLPPLSTLEKIILNSWCNPCRE